MTTAETQLNAVDRCLIRTALFVPGNRPELIDKALSTAADLVIMDLEDVVPLSEKVSAREVVRQKMVLGDVRPAIARINGIGTGFCTADITAIMTPDLAGIMLPKVESHDHVDDIHARLLTVEADSGKAPGSMTVILLIETAMGIYNAVEILSRRTTPARRFIAAFGAADYAVDLSIDITLDGTELIYPRSHLALASRIANIAPPLDTPFVVDLKNLDAMKTDGQRAKQLGFQGKLCIHPSQIGPLNQIFSPSPDEVAFARKAVAAFEESVPAGKGAIQVDGRFIDLPVVTRCKKILALALRTDAAVP